MEEGSGVSERAERLGQPMSEQFMQATKAAITFRTYCRQIIYPDRSAVARSVSNVCVLAGGPPLRFVGVACLARSKGERAATKQPQRALWGGPPLFAGYVCIHPSVTPFPKVGNESNTLRKHQHDGAPPRRGNPTIPASKKKNEFVKMTHNRSRACRVPDPPPIVKPTSLPLQTTKFIWGACR
jgi:hypothetical protein